MQLKLIYNNYPLKIYIFTFTSIKGSKYSLPYAKHIITRVNLQITSTKKRKA